MDTPTDIRSQAGSTGRMQAHGLPPDPEPDEAPGEPPHPPPGEPASPVPDHPTGDPPKSDENAAAFIDMPMQSAQSAAQSIAGEEDPGAGVDLARAAMAPGDQARPGTPGTGEGVCPRCGGKGTVEEPGSAGAVPCPECEGTGRLVVGIGGA